VERTHNGIEAWFQTQHGHRVLHHFRKQLRLLYSTLKGDKILQLGLTNTAPLFMELDFSNKWVLSPSPSGDTHTIRASYDFLPFEAESLNSILVPLSFCERSFQDWPLDEVDRVLSPMGYVIFFAVNPISLWGVGMRSRKFSFIDKKVLNLPSLLQLKIAMIRRGYQHYFLRYFYYLPPVRKNISINRFRVIEQMGELFPPWPAAFYFLVMKKSSIIDSDIIMPAIQHKISLPI
jgi:hypothetical protein